MRRSPEKPANKRGSPEAVAKRKAARKLNRLLLGPAPSAATDGRTARRRQRLLQELADGTRDPASGLKPIEVLQHVDDLLGLGETVASLRKVVTVHPRDVAPDAARALLQELQRTYAFRPEAYQFLGLPDAVLRAADLSPPRKR